MTSLSDLDNNQLFDSIIEDVGSFGVFQKRTLGLSLVVSALAAFNHLSPIYYLFTPQNYTCSHGQAIENNSCLIEEGGRSVGCQEWSFPKDTFTSTVVTQWNLVCENASQIPIVASSYMAGVFLINCAAGFLSDNWLGRRKTILWFSLAHIAFSFGTAFAQSFGAFLAIRFFVGGSIHAVWSSYFVCSIETVRENKKAFTGGVFNGGWNFGSLCMVGLAYLIRSWNYLQITFASIALLLLETNQYEESEKNLRSIAKFNGRELENSEFNQKFEELKRRYSDAQKDVGNAKAKALISNREYMIRLGLLVFPWIAVGTSSYGVHFSVSLVQYDVFTVTAIKELAAILLLFLGTFIYKRVKHIPCTIAWYTLGGSFGILYYLLPETEVTARMVVFCLCQATILACFYMIDTYTQDVFSTDVRNLTFNVLDSISKLGTVIAPFIVNVGEPGSGLPLVIFGVLMVGSSLPLFFTPETKGAPLLQSHRDMRLYSCRETSLIGNLLRKLNVSSQLKKSTPSN